MSRPRHLHERTLGPVRVRVAVDVHDGVGAKVNRVRAGGVRGIEVIGVEHLHRQRFPAAGRSAVGGPRPARADPAEARLDERHELLHDGVAVRPEVRRVHGVRVVVVRVRVLDLNHEHARKVRSRPFPVEVVRGLLLGAVVAVDLKALAVLALQVGVGRRLAPVAEVGREVAVVDDERVPCVGVRVEAFRQEDVRAEVHVSSPELRQPLAPDAHVLHVLGIRRCGQRRNDRVQLEANRIALRAVPPYFLRRAVDVAGRAVPLLALTAIHRQLDGVARGQAERLVLVQQRLHGVLARRQIAERCERVARDARVEAPLVPGLQSLDVDAEGLRRRQARRAQLEARLARAVLRQQQQEPSVERFLRRVRAEADDEPARGLRRGPNRRSGRSGERDRKREKQERSKTSHDHLLDVVRESGADGNFRCAARSSG